MTIFTVVTSLETKYKLLISTESHKMFYFGKQISISKYPRTAI